MNRYIVTLILDQAKINDMGHYVLNIFDENTGKPFEPHLNMSLFVQAKPKLSLANKPSIFHMEEQNIKLTYKILSYPLNETK